MVNQRSPVFLFIGNDNYLKERAIKDLASSLLGDSSKDLDYKVFYAGETEPSEALGHINTIPFLASRRLVVVRDLEKAHPEFIDRLIGYMKKPLKTTCLILEASGDSILKDYPEISRHASVRAFGEMTEREVSIWVKDFLTARKKMISADAITLLKEMRGHDLTALTQELEKLVSYTGQRAEINIADIGDLIGKSLISSTFDLADAIGSANAQEAVMICHDLMKAGKKEYEIVGLLCWHFKRILKAKVLQARGESDNRIAYALKIGQRYWAGFFRQVSGMSLAQIKSKIKELLEADLDIKRTRFDQTLVLEFAVIRLCSGKASS